MVAATSDELFHNLTATERLVAPRCRQPHPVHHQQQDADQIATIPITTRTSIKLNPRWRAPTIKPRLPATRYASGDISTAPALTLEPAVPRTRYITSRAATTTAM